MYRWSQLLFVTTKMNSKSSPSPIQKALDLAKRRPFDQVKQASAENEYAKLKEATDFVNNNNNEKVNYWNFDEKYVWFRNLLFKGVKYT